MRRADLKYLYSESLIATEPKTDFRVARLNEVGEPEELSVNQIWDLFKPGDVLVINDSRVESRRVFAADLEILFLKRTAEMEWEVLFPARAHKIGDQIALPGGVTATLTSKGLPQTLALDQSIGEKYFAEFGEPALPPYIQRARNERHARKEDQIWYQTAWAKEPGSAAAPTASLHFTEADLTELRNRGVEIAFVTLHVGLGTFLPMKADNLKDHVMHSEQAFIPASSINMITTAQAEGKRIWALGTTALRSIEAWAAGDLSRSDSGDYCGSTRLFIQPGFEFKVASGLLTNFHQPESTLLALVMAFAGRTQVLRLYDWAIQKQFRLFSYGDLTVWTR